MIYSVNESSNTYTESVALFGQDADDFLESVEVALYEDTVAIGENVYDGADAEAFLAENGIMLYEDHIVLEGKQAEEYKARKAKEREEAKEKDNLRNSAFGRVSIGKFPDSMYPNANKYADKYNSYGLHKDDIKVSNKAHELQNRDKRTKLNKATYNARDEEKSKKYFDSWSRASDANLADIERHIRRHPKQFKESAFFDFDLK